MQRKTQQKMKKVNLNNKHLTQPHKTHTQQQQQHKNIFAILCILYK